MFCVVDGVLLRFLLVKLWSFTVICFTFAVWCCCLLNFLFVVDCLISACLSCSLLLVCWLIIVSVFWFWFVV